MKVKYFLPVMLSAVLGLTACNNDDDNPGNARLQVRMTDAPGDYEEVNVDIREVRVHRNANAGDNDGNWILLSNINPGVYNLLDFANGKDTLLASSELPAGQISQIRLVLGPNNSLKLKDGSLVDLKTPSGQQSGLKVQIHQELKADVSYVILLDFDASRSVVPRGNGEYNLKPVIRAITNAVAGGIRGTVTPVAAEPHVMVISASNDTVGTVTDANGNFLVKGLTNGSYKVVFDAADGYSDITVNSVSVTNDQITNMGTIDLN